MNEEWLLEGLKGIRQLKAQWKDFTPDETLAIDDALARQTLSELIERLKDNYPFWNPVYAGQMLKPPHEIASIAYFLAQQINPNNHALDGGPATAKMEVEVVAQLAAMFGFTTHLGHLTSSGTIANLEALWVAHKIHPDKGIAYSEEAHYTHGRMCEVIGASGVPVSCDPAGRLDPKALGNALADGKIGTVVVTPGTTGLGAIDQIHEIQKLRERYGFRMHVDGAYGGFFRLLADEKGLLSESDCEAFKAIADCDSIVVDPHKHGLQPYGCGSVLFRDPAVGKYYVHDSPYTYFTSADLHLGEISLECSRAGAAAAALWATVKCFPLKRDGLGRVLEKTRGAALRWAEIIKGSEELELVVEPSLDIVVFYPKVKGNRASEINRVVNRVFSRLMEDSDDPLYLAKLNLKRKLVSPGAGIEWDEANLLAFRSVLMKPEHFDAVPAIHERLMKELRSSL